MKRKINLLVFCLCLSIFAFSQRTVTGIVVDENNEPIIGVNVIVKGSSLGTITDLKGLFKISNVTNRTVLQFTYIGYKLQELPIGNLNEVKVKLEPNNVELEDVVVIGYGSVRKSDLTGSVTSIKADALEKSLGASFENALAGKMAGVQVTQNSGTPGGGSTITIRGNNSLGSGSPLYIIDGVPYDNTGIGGFESAGASVSPLSLINPSDIESMEVLKDASGTAIYGSRASNGVIIITTKMGRVGLGRVNFDIDYGVSKFNNFIKLLDANQYYLIRSESGASVDPATLDLANRGMLPNYNWQDIVFKDGMTFNANLSFSGGTNAVKYLVSLNRFEYEGVLSKTGFKRTSGRVNVDYQLNKRLKMGARVNLSNIQTDGLPASTNVLGGPTGTNSIISRALRMRPYVNPDASWIQTYDPADFNDIEDYSPLMAINSITQQNNSNQTQANVFGEYEIMKDLSFRITGNYTARNDAARYYQSRNMPYGYSEGGWARIMNTNLANYSNENTLSYNKQIDKKNRINAVLGMSFQISDLEAISNSVKGFPNDKLLWNNLSAGVNIEPSTNMVTQTNLVSWFSRVNYSLMDKYLITLTGRVDGSSKFSKGNKYGFFPAGALAWRVNQEEWLKDVSAIHNLKLRTSYGVTGNQSLQPYQSLIQMASNSMIFGNSDGVNTEYVGYSISNSLPNINLRWETTEQYNVGLDLGLFKGRIEFVADYYVKNTHDLLVSAQIPKTTGYATSLLNFGALQNKGYEFALTGEILKSKKFNWSSTLNVSFNKTVVVDLVEDHFDSGYSLPWNGHSTQILIKGEELGIFWGYKRDGIRQQDDPELPYTVVNKAVEVGDQKYMNYKEDGVINAEDKTIIGKVQPDFTFGFNNTFSAYGFDISMFIDGSYGGQIFNINAIQGMNFGQLQQFETVMQRWTPENPSNIYPKVKSTNNETNFMISDRYIEDASFIRIQNITLGYELPKTIISKLKLSKLRLYCAIQNLHTFSNYSGYSPDVSVFGNNSLSMGHDNGSYPNPTNFKMGLNVGF